MLYPYNFLLCSNAIDPMSHKFSLCWYNDLLYPIGSDQPGAPRPPSRTRTSRRSRCPHQPSPHSVTAKQPFVHRAQFSNGPAAPSPTRIRGRGTREGRGDPAVAIFDTVFKMSKKCKNRPLIIFDSLFKMSKKYSPEILNTFPPTAQKRPRRNFEHISGNGQKTPLPQYWTEPPRNPKKAPLTPAVTPP